MKEMQETKYLTIPEAAEFLGFKMSYVYKLITLRQIPFLKYGPRFVRFDAAVLQEWKDARFREVPTRAQMQAEATRYCLNHPRT